LHFIGVFQTPVGVGLDGNLPGEFEGVFVLTRGHENNFHLHVVLQRREDLESDFVVNFIGTEELVEPDLLRNDIHRENPVPLFEGLNDIEIVSTLEYGIPRGS